MSLVYDCIVVGSGPSGVQAAQTLLEGGFKVGMLDVGVDQDQFYKKQLPASDFDHLRKSDPNQHLYFLGKNLDSVHADWMGTQDRLTPPLAFTKRLVAEWQTQTKSRKHIAFMESLAKGGLGNAWGRGAFTYDRSEQEKLGLSTDGWREAYEQIASRIGISGTKGIGADLTNLMPALLIDRNMQTLRQSYQRYKSYWKKKGIFLERTPLAVQNQANAERPTEQYWDLDFWSLQKSAGYHPGHTLSKLMASPNFHYLPQHYVYKFKERGNQVEILAKHTESRVDKTFIAKRLLICASVLGTARIVLNSLSQGPKKLPLLCNSFSYGTWLNMRMFGRQNSIKKSSFSQLSVFQRKDQTSSFNLLSLYTYRSLLLTKLIRELPLSFRFGYQVSAIIKEMLVIGGLHLPERYHSQNYLQLLPSTSSPIGKDLDIHYKHDEVSRKKALRQINKAMLGWGAIPMLFQSTDCGSSKHYAGTLPSSPIAKPYQLAPSGRLHFTQNIYIGDASGFCFLPAKGPTLTIMANAHRVAQQILSPRKIQWGKSEAISSYKKER